MLIRLILVALLVAGTQARADQPLAVVEQVDLQRYMGTWYEIARLPHFFQNGCINSSADYALNDDGTVSVINRCERLDQPAKQAEGVARVVDEQTRAKLKVRFLNWFSRLFPWLTEGDYWIIHLDQDYQHAMVGAPNRQYLWLLSRQPDMTDEQLAALLAKARELGFPVEQLVLNRDLRNTGSE